MGDWDFINDHMGGFDAETGLPNFMNEPTSRKINIKSEEESKKILEEMYPIEERRNLGKPNYSKLFEHLGAIFLFHKKITEKEFDELTLKASQRQLSKEEYEEIVNRFSKEEWLKLKNDQKKNNPLLKKSKK
jgi:hypothetical protein